MSSPLFIRDIKRLTSMMILSRIAQDPYIRGARIAEYLDISVQAASDYLKELQMNGYILRDELGFKLTEQGFQFLQDFVENLKKFLLETIDSIPLINQTEAIALRDLPKGEKVNLMMKDGFLWAGSENWAGSTGVVVKDAVRGDLVLLKELEGIVQHRIGTVFLVIISSLSSTNRDYRKEAESIINYVGKCVDKVFIIPLDERGEVFWNKASSTLNEGNWIRIVKLPPLGVPILGLIKGMCSVLLGSEESIRDAESYLQRAEKEYGVTIPKRSFLL